MPHALPAARSTPARRRVSRVARAMRAPLGRKWMWARALALVALVRLGLWTVSLRTLQVLVARLGRGIYSEPLPRPSPATAGEGAPQLERRSSRDTAAEHEASWAITHASRLVPMASCLTQALSLQVLLGQRGLGSRLCIGVRKSRDKGFEAHAWVESDGRILIGGQQQARMDDNWTPLTSWDFEPVASHGAARESTPSA